MPANYRQPTQGHLKAMASEEDIVKRARDAFAAYSDSLGKGIIVELCDEIVLLRERLRAARSDADFYKKLAEKLPEIFAEGSE